MNRDYDGNGRGNADSEVFDGAGEGAGVDQAVMEASCAHHHPRAEEVGLTKNERLVWETLKARGGPLKAYEILDVLKDHGVRAPMTVYRALEGLEAKGLIHKLEALNAFVVCNHDAPHKLQVFLMCERCPTVSEIEIEGLEGLVLPVAKQKGYSMDVARLEVRGKCASCASEA